MPQKPQYSFFKILLAIHACTFFLAIYFKGIYLKDSYEYLNQSINLSAYGSWYAAPWNGPILIDYFSFRPPLYAIFILLAKLLVNSDLSILFLQNVLSIVNLLLVYRLAQKVIPNFANTKTMVLMVLLFPTQLLLANMVMSDILLQTLLMFLCYACFKFYHSPQMKWSMLMSVLLCLLLLTKPVTLFFSLVIVVWMGYAMMMKRNSNTQFVKYFLPLLLVPLTFHVICLQQKHQTGFYHYSSMKPFTQFKFNARFVLANKYGEEYAEHWSDSSKQVFAQATDYQTRYEWMQQAGDEVLKKEPLLFIKLYLKGCVVFLLDPGRHELVSFFQMDDSQMNGLFYEINTKGISAVYDFMKHSPILLLCYLALIFIWNLIIVGLLILFFRSPKIPSYLKLLMGLFVGYMILTTGLLGVARYRAPIFPELMLVVLVVMSTHPFEWLKMKST